MLVLVRTFQCCALVLALSCTGCREPANQPSAEAESRNAPESGDGQSQEAKSDEPAHERASVDGVMRVRNVPLPRTTKYFLVAGSSRVANFAEEIVEQKKLWLETGARPEEIACYYIVPYQEEFDSDLEQFRSLAPELGLCYPASMALLRRHLGEATIGPFLYLYVTSHGERPIPVRLRDMDPDDDGYHQLERRSLYPVFDEYRMVIEGLPDGTANASELLGAFRTGFHDRDLYFNAHHLAEMLDRFAATPKVIVLNGCFSGGFWRDPRRPDPQPLQSVPGLTLLTAASHDRESFGCRAGDVRTFYGAAYNDALAEVAIFPRDMDWRALHDRVAARVAEIEKQEDAKPSRPQFFSTSKSTIVAP